MCAMSTTTLPRVSVRLGLASLNGAEHAPGTQYLGYEEIRRDVPDGFLDFGWFAALALLGARRRAPASTVPVPNTLI